jgi:hypothetical protein
MAFTQDWLSDLVTYLLADDTVDAQVSGRGYKVEMRSKSDLEAMPRKAFVINRSGGNSDDYLPVGTERMDVYHYGANYGEAHEVRRAVHTALKSINRLFQGTTLIYSVTHSSGPNDVRFPSDEWPATIDTWKVNAAEVAVT